MDPIQSFLDTYEHSDGLSIPEQAHAICCCGNDACSYLKQNQKSLEGLEEKLSTAGRLGQVWNAPC